MKIKITYYSFLFLFVLSCSLSAQQGWWTWLKGSATAGGAATYGTLGVPAPANTPPSMYQSAACWVDSKGVFWQYGGGNGNYSSALFKYDPATNMWTWVQGSSTLGLNPVWGTQGVAAPTNTPGSRGMGIATWVDANDNLWLFGGNAMGSNGGFKGWMHDLWKYDPVTNMWTWVHGPSTSNSPGVYGTKGIPNPNNVPAPRYECNATWVDNNGKFWMFGGGSNTGTLNDLWKYDPVSNQWTWMKGSQTAGNAGSYGTKGVPLASNEPPARWAYCRWKDNNGNFWLFGGTHSSNTQSMNDMWMFNPSTNNWTWVSGTNLKDQLPPIPTKCNPSTTNYPQARYENPIAWKDLCGNLWMFGGHWAPGLSVPDINDIWCYKVQTNEWVFVGGNIGANNGTQGVPAASNMPSAHYSSAAWSYNNVFYFFGGRNNTGSDVNTLWRYYPDTTCAGSTCNVQINPTAGFNGTNLTGCASLTVSFTNTSTNATSWSWNFGDGNISTLQNPVHTYTIPGTYNVQLIAYNGTNSDTLIQNNYVTVYSSAVASFTSSNDTVCVGQVISFTNNSTNANSYSWNFGDGNSSTNINPTHSYASTGNYIVTLIALGSNNCNDTITDTLTVLSANVTAAYAASPIQGCGPLNVIFTNNSTGATYYSWNFGNGQTSNAVSPTYNYTAAGTYTVTLIAGTNSICGVAEDSVKTIVITVGSSPSLSINSTQTSCTGNTGTATVTPSGGTSPFTYSWNNGQTSATATGLGSGTYTVTVTDALGCTATSNVSVSTVNGPNASISAGSPISCFGGINGSAIVTANGGTAPYTYSWNPGGATTQTATGLAAGTYSVIITDASGCTTLQSITIAQPTAINSSISSTPDTCSKNIGTATAIASGGTAGYTYNWNNGGTSATISGLSTGTYSVLITDANNCTNTQTVIVSPYSTATITASANVTITYGASANLSATGGIAYSWTPPVNLSCTNCPNPIATPSATTTYTVYGIDAYGCSNFDSVTVTVETPCYMETLEKIVPNAFSPNGDGKNDVLCISQNICIRNFNLKIFDRWGSVLFETSDYSRCWDGTYNDKLLNSAGFIYVFNAEIINGDTINQKGIISLIR